MLLIMLAVTGYPLISTVRLSFTDTILTGHASMFHWVGWDNFRYVFTDPDFGDAFWRTLYFTIVSVGIEMVLGVLVGLLLDCEFRGRAIMRALIVLPWALPTIVNATLWRLIYNPQYGALNALLTQTGVIGTYQSWLGQPGSAMTAIILADVWKNFPLVALIALAALQTVPREIKSASIVDGAGVFARFRFVVWPYLAGPLMVALVLRTMDAFRVFDIFYSTTNGGPADATNVLMIYAVKQGLEFFNVGFASAIANLMIVCIAIFSVAFIALIRRADRRANEL